MATVLAALQSAAVRLNGTRPPTIFSSTDQFEMELADLANEVAKDIAASHDWQALQKIAVFDGDGENTDFSPPSDYDRMTIKSDMLEYSAFGWNYARIGDLNEWLLLTRDGYSVSPGHYILSGGLFRFVPAPASGAQVRFPYISNAIVIPHTDTDETQFWGDEDQFRLSDRLLTLGVIWRWREQKKLDTSTEQAAFQKAFDEIAGRDKGSRIFIEGPSRFPGNVTVAYPRALGV